MVDKQLKRFSAVQLKYMLITLMVILLASGGGLFWFIRSKLVEHATNVQGIRTEASSTSSDIIRLQGLQKQLEQENVAVTRAKNIIISTKDDKGINNYDYQNKILTDLEKYSDIANVPVLSITFVAQGDTAPATPDPTGLKKLTVNLTLGTPVTYKNLLTFISLLEHNLTKMQLTGIPLVNGTPGTAETSLSLSSLTLEIYTR